MAAAGSPAAEWKPRAQASLIPEAEWIQPGRPFTLALKLKMQEGWHTYWRYPGDSGLPTAIAWRLPQGYRAGEIQWPSPSLIRGRETVGYGYEGEVLLLSELEAPAQAKGRAEIKAKAQWLACREICVPESAELVLSLPVRDREIPRKEAEKFARARRLIPRRPEDPGFRGWSFVAFRGPKTLRLQAKMPRPGLASRARFFPYEEGLVEDAKPQRARLSGQTLTLEMAPPRFSGSPPAELRGVLVLGQGERAVELRLPIQNARRRRMK